MIFQVSWRNSRIIDRFFYQQSSTIDWKLNIARFFRDPLKDSSGFLKGLFDNWPISRRKSTTIDRKLNVARSFWDLYKDSSGFFRILQDSSGFIRILGGILGQSTRFHHPSTTTDWKLNTARSFQDSYPKDPRDPEGSLIRSSWRPVTQQSMTISHQLMTEL